MENTARPNQAIRQAAPRAPTDWIFLCATPPQNNEPAPCEVDECATSRASRIRSLSSKLQIRNYIELKREQP